MIQRFSSRGDPIFSKCLDGVVHPGESCQKNGEIISSTDQVA